MWTMSTLLAPPAWPAWATDSFLVPLDPVRVLVAKNNKENHQKYDRLAIETIRLPGLQAAEFTDMSNLAKNVLGVQQAAIEPNQGTLTVRAPVDTRERTQQNGLPTCSMARARCCSTSKSTRLPIPGPGFTDCNFRKAPQFST